MLHCGLFEVPLLGDELIQPPSNASTSFNAAAIARRSNKGGMGTPHLLQCVATDFRHAPEEPAATVMKKRLPFALFA